MDLSIIIPAYNESGKIAADVKAAAEFLTGSGLTGEIIVVDDGSSDGTSDVANQAGNTLPDNMTLRVINYQLHRGKGYAVKTGVKQTNGQFLMFADSGKCVPYNDVLPGLELIKKGTCDIAHGSRKMQQSHIERAQSPYRRLCSKAFHWFVIWYLGIPPELTDTQCGFKIYKADVAKHLYDECTTDGFMFDIEIIVRAQKEGYKIKEFPIDWTCDPDSRLSPTRNAWQVLSELINIRRTIDGK